MKRIRYFILLAGTILLVAALTRFLIVFGHSQVFSLPEPVLGIPLRCAVLLVGLIELAGACLCLFGNRISLQAGCVAWLGVNYTVYKLGVLAMGEHGQATAVGILTDPLRIAGGFMGLTAGFAPFCLLLGGSASSIWLWFDRRSSNRPIEKSVKMSCPGCGMHIRFDSSNLGQVVSCPQCTVNVILRMPDETLKTSCHLCHQKIEFPAHALGRKLKCPYCSGEILLKEIS